MNWEVSFMKFYEFKKYLKLLKIYKKFHILIQRKKIFQYLINTYLNYLN